MILRKNIQFSEVQQFRQTWLWFLLLSSTLISVVPVLVATLQGEMRTLEGLAAMGLVLLITGINLVLFYITKLEIKISDEGIAYRWWPYFRKFTLLKWSDVEFVQMQKYAAMSYGFHISKKYGRIHNVDGNQAYQVVLQNGKKYLFGTQKKLSVENALQQSGKMKL